MSIDENKALYRRWFEEVVNERDMGVADELLSADYALHFPGMPGPLDRQGHKQLLAMFHRAFLDWKEAVENVIAEGDKVVIRVTGRGRHEGEFMGTPPSGRDVTAEGVGIGRLAGGKIVESWAAYDALGLMQQIGAVPAPGG